MSKVRKWKKIGPHLTLGENHSKRLIDQSFRNPSTGQTIVHTLFDSDGISVIIFPLTIKMEVVAVKQFRPGIGEVVTELPGGNADLGKENFVKAAERELLEETSHQAGRIIPLLNKLWMDPGTCTPYLVPFLALGCEKIKTTQNDENEIIETLSIPISSWIDMMLHGKVLDMKTIAVSFLAVSHLSERVRKNRVDLSSRVRQTADWYLKNRETTNGK